MGNLQVSNIRAGFVDRFIAIWIDLFIVWIGTKFIVMIFNQIGIYIPFELFFGLIFMCYSVSSIGWKSCTKEPH